MNRAAILLCYAIFTLASSFAQNERPQWARRQWSINYGDGYQCNGRWWRYDRYAGTFYVECASAEAVEPLVNELTAPGNLFEGYTAAVRLLSQNAFFLDADFQLRQELKICPRKIDEKVEFLRARPGVVIANAVLLTRDGYYLMLMPRNEIIVKLKDPSLAETYFGVDFPKVRRIGGTTDQFVLPIAPATREWLFFKVNLINLDAEVAWAEPNFLGQAVLPPFYFAGLPDDPPWDGVCFPVRPNLLLSRRGSNLVLSGQGQPLKISRIEAASDVTTWSVLTNFTTPDPFSLELPPAEPQRFYRLIQY